MSLEWEILLAGSRVALDKEDKQRLQQLCRAAIDWHNLIHLAGFHRTTALLYRQLRRHCGDALPAEVMQSLLDRTRQQGMNNLMMAGVLVQALGMLNGHGILAVPFKGPVFTDAVFGDLALRSYCDLDILIAQSDLPGAVKALEAEGFAPCFPLSDSHLMMMAETDNEYPLRHGTNGVVIDLQWELTGGYSPRPVHLDSLIPNLRNIDFMGRPVQVFGSEDLLVYLCVHGNQHVWEQLDQVCCVAETVRACRDLDWDAVWLRAAELGAGRMVCAGLLLASSLLGVELSAEVMATIHQDRRAVALARERSDNLSRPRQQGTQELTSRRFVLHHWKSLASPWQAFRYGCHILFVPTRYDWVKLPLPSWMRPVHYLYRPLRLIVTWLVAASRRIVARTAVRNH